MPPKARSRLSSAGDGAKSPQKAPLWAFADSTHAGGWRPYSAHESRLIEVAYLAGFRSVTLGSYIVNTKMMKQVHAADPSRERAVKRFLVDPAALKASALADSSGSGEPGVVGRVSSARGNDLTAKGLPSTRSASADVLSRKCGRGETVCESTRSVPIVALSPSLRLSAKPLHSPESSCDVSQPRVAFSLQSLRRGTGGKFSVVNDAQLQVDHHLAATVRSVLLAVPEINRMSLSCAADKMYKGTRRWLASLGRAPEERGVFIQLAKPLASLNPRDTVKMTSKFAAPVSALQGFARDARVTYFGDAMPSPLLLPCSDAHKAASMSKQQHLQTQLLMVSGPALVLYDNDYDPVPDPPIVCVASTPGINFAYCSADIEAFTHCPTDPKTGISAGHAINTAAALGRMKQIWLHVLIVLDEVHHVEFAVMCAIGCGAFRGAFGSQVPWLWGTALVHALAERRAFKRIKGVFVSLPTFGSDNNYAPFRSGADAAMRDVPPAVAACMPPLILVEDASMLSIAAHLSAAKFRVGVLNPSDVQALRHGWIGMYWDGGHIALEEVLAMQTSILLQHVGLNRALYSSSAMRMIVNADRR